MLQPAARPKTLAQGEQFVDAMVDLLPSDEPSSRSPEALAQEMVSQLGESPAQTCPPHIARDHIRSWAPGGELQKGAVGQYLMGTHGAWHIVQSEGQVMEQLLSAGSESLLSPAADTDDRPAVPSAPVVDDGAQLVVALAILGLAAVAVLCLVRRRCSTQYRTVSSRIEAAALPMDDERDSEEPEYL